MEIFTVILAGILCIGPIITVLYATSKVNGQLQSIHALVNERLTTALNEIISLRKIVAEREQTIRDLEQS